MPKITAPHDYQLNVINQAFAIWRENTIKNICLVAPTGAGKTLIKSFTAKYFTQMNPDKVVVIFAHRDILLSQISLAVASIGLPHRMICSQKTKKTIGDMHLEELGECFLHDKANVIVASVPTWIKRDTVEISKMVGLWAMDECFTPSAIIDGKSIKDINVGDYVTAFNESAMVYEKRKVTRKFKNVQPETMVRIDTVGHHVLHCTLGHPIYTKRGWVEAGNLDLYDEVLTHDLSMYQLQHNHSETERTPNILLSENRTDILQKRLRMGLRGEKQKKKGTSDPFFKLPHLQKRVSGGQSKSCTTKINRSGLLFQKMLVNLPVEKFFFNHGENKSKVCQSKNERKKSNEKRGNQKKSCRNFKSYESSTFCKRWKRETSNISGSCSERFVFRIRVRESMYCENRLFSGGVYLSTSLQNRLRKSCFENSNRSGWSKSQSFEKETTRQEKGRFFNWKRLASLSIYKSGNNEFTSESKSDGYVYNIEVEGLHTYVANNVTVHNCHHTLKENMWGKAVENMQHAYGLGVTATPLRADGKGLGKQADGVAECIIKTPGMGELIKMGRLSNYVVYTPPNHVDTTGVNITAGGDYNQQKLAKATDKKHITGDAIAHYKKLANGKQGIIFAASIAHSDHVAHEFRLAGINAVALSSKTNDTIRAAKIRDFRQGRIQLLVNYDLFGEGFDVPAVEVVIMLRKTLSYGLFKQMFGRCLRVLKGKEYGILIDHVGNVVEHCLPGKHLHEDPEWSLDGSKKRSQSTGEDIIARVCSACFHYYVPATRNIKSYICPSCNHNESDVERIAVQKEIQIKDGVLVEFNTGHFDELMKEIKKVDMPVDQFKNHLRNAPPVVMHSAVNNHKARQEAQIILRQWIVQWCNETGEVMGLDVPTTQGEFNRIFNVDIFTAQTLGSRKASELTDKIKFNLIEKRLFA